MPDTQRSVIGFPCTFPLKVIGKNVERFHVDIIAIVRRHVPSLRDDQVVGRPSGKGTYRSLTITFIAESREQLDALYRDLNSHEHTVLVL